MAASTGRITQHLVNRTLHCAHLPRAIHTHNFLVCTWLEMFELSCVLSFLKFIPSHPCFVARCLSAAFFAHHSLLRFRHLHPVLRLLLRSSFLGRVQPLPLRKEGCSLAAWPNSHLSQVASPSLSSKSAASTLRSTYLREKAVSTRTSTISRPRWMRLK